MEFLKQLLRKDFTKRMLVLLLIGLFFFIMRGMINLFLLTFLFTYITYSLEKNITKWLGKYIPINQVLLTFILYLLIFIFIAFVIYKYIPLMIIQVKQIIEEIQKFNIDSIGGGFVTKYIMPYLDDIDFTSLTKGNGLDQIVNFATNVGKWSLNIFLAMVLSMFFMLEKDKVKKFMLKFNKSRVAGLYRYTRDFGRNFLNSFGKVIQAQIIIAFVNSVLSVIAFWILGFPQLLGLGVMIFIFSLVPVAGTIVSLVPLSMIAYRVGGVQEILYVLILIAVLHSLESYVLNPKLMADKTELPVFFIFIILIISEHFMGTWGLLIGVPLFMFLLDLINVKTEG